MLNEIIDSIGFDNIEKGLSNDDLSGSLVFLADETDIIQLDMSNQSDKTNLEIKAYIRERLFYSNYINSDKAIVQDKKYQTIKMALGANKFSIIFNIEKLFKNGKDFYDEDYKAIFDDIISNYYESLRNKFKVNTIKEEEIINKYKENIFVEVMKPENKKKKVRIFIKASLEDYKEEFEKYFYLMISDSGTETPLKKDKELLAAFRKQGAVKVGLFSGLNADKPLLSNIGAKFLYPHVYNKENLMRFYKLKKYLEINVKSYKYPFDDKGSFILYDCKEKRIDDYEVKVFRSKKLNDEESFKFDIKDLLNFGNEDKKVKTRKDLLTEINSYIDYAITKSPARGKVRILSQKYKNILSYCEYDEKNKSYDFNIDDEMFDIKIKSLIDDVLIYNKLEKTKDEYGVLKMRAILNIKFALKNYYKTTNIEGDDILRVKDSFKQKILSNEDEVFDSIEECLFGAGQLAICLANKHKGKKTNALISGYQSIRDYKRLMVLLKNDMLKYGYITNLNSRENKVFGMIKLFIKDENLDGFIKANDKDWLDIGLYTKVLFYEKKEN